MAYDGDGKRRRTEDTDGLRNIVWDLENILVETDSGGSAVARYTLAPEVYGALISQRRGGATSFHHFDALGSTRALTNSAQTPTDTRDYRAFGLTNASSGSTANRFWWVGKLGYYSQKDTGDYWVRANILLPAPGRWQKRDELCNRLILTVERNCYLYTGNQPVGIVDPSGLRCKSAESPGNVYIKCKDVDKGPGAPGMAPEKGIIWKPANDCPRSLLVLAIKTYSAIRDKKCGKKKSTGASGSCIGSAGAAGLMICCQNDCEECECRLFFSQIAMDQEPGCVQRCIYAHEMVHCRHCLADNMHPGNPEECSAYTEMVKCLESFLKLK